MVTVHIHRQLNHLSVKSNNYLGQIKMIESFAAIILKDQIGEFFNQSLNGSGTMDVQRNVNDLADRVHDDLVESFRISHLNDLLAEIVAELISHHTWENRQHLIH